MTAAALLRCLLSVGLAGLLVACAGLPPLPQPETLLDDAAFAPPAVPVDAAQVFALSAPMREYLDVTLAPQRRRKGARDALVEALYSRQQLRIEYDAAVTRNAAQAFEARAGNCLALVVMTASLARHLGLPVQFNDVLTDENWSRAGDLMVNAGHVNITLGQRAAGDRLGWDDGHNVTIDFDPPRAGARPLVRAIDERTVVAMFMNNRAAESLVGGDVDSAYWWVRGALEQQPTFTPAYNTLAVVYQRRGRADRSERVLRQLLEREPANTALLANLQRALQLQGRDSEAQEIGRRLARVEPVPPFHWYLQGVEALKRQDYRAAREAFAREAARAAYLHEVHYGLALAQMGLGDVRAAQHELELAVQTSLTGRERDLYAGKLARLEDQRRSLRTQ